MLTITLFKYLYVFFQTSIGRLSSPGTVVPFAFFSDRSISCSVIGCHNSSVSGAACGLGSGVFITEKKASRKACALSLFSISSSEPTRSAGVHPHASRGFMYVAAFQSFPSPVSSRNCLQCEALAFSMVRVHNRRFFCMVWKAVVVLAWSCPSSAQRACHFLRS